MKTHYDIIVVGAGHAGNEAAAAAANLGSSVLLITMNMNTIGQMSCNPAMGGVAKGQIVREIDALGGLSGIVSDKTAIQFRMLNKSKGAAMWSPRTQNDRYRFALEWRAQLEKIPNLHFRQDTISALTLDHGRITGVLTSQGSNISARAVILTSGTFLNGVIHIGLRKHGGGRAGEPSSTGITEFLTSQGFEHGRMKTGTPPRIDGRSLDYSKMEIQPGDPRPVGFSFMDVPKLSKQLPCHITYTNQTVHDILREGFDRSPMYTGRIEGAGPRYCPSIEDKIDRFADKDRHQIFVEPEGLDTVEVYVNGFSTSLPEEIQDRAIKHIPGFENARLFRPGYAIEYDYFPPTQLNSNLETSLVKGLFFAGQINGTTGYEEAACQGLLAGLNAHHTITDKAPVILSRHEAYIGVLIDDLITKGTKEPYRMFTSRAEYRISLRQDNADERLTPLGAKLGLADNNRVRVFDKKQQNLTTLRKYCHSHSVLPEEVNTLLAHQNTAPIEQKSKISTLLSRPQISAQDFLNHLPALQIGDSAIDLELLEMVETEIKYSGYLLKEREAAEKMVRLESNVIPVGYSFENLTSLSKEARQKLSFVKPTTIGQATRISGVSPSDISVLMVALGR